MTKRRLLRHLLFVVVIVASVFLALNHVHQHQHNLYLTVLSIMTFAFACIQEYLKENDAVADHSDS